MTPRVRRMALGVVIGMAALLASIWVLAHTLGDHDTLYQGKPIEYWVTQADSQAAGPSAEAAAVIQSTIIPSLVSSMFTDTNDSRLRIFLVDQLNELPGVVIHFSQAETRRCGATGMLGELGARARGTIPDLIRAIKGTDPVVRPFAAHSLGKLRSEPDTVIPLLVSLLDDPQDNVPEFAAEALGEFGKLSATAVPKLVGLSKVQDKDLRHAVSQALKQIDPAAAAQAGIR